MTELVQALLKHRDSYKPTKEHLTSFLSGSQVFKQVDARAAANELYTRFFPEKKESYACIVYDGDPAAPEVVGIFSDITYYILLKQILPGCWYTSAFFDEHSQDVMDGCKVYDVKAWQDGAVEYVKQTNSYKDYELDYNLGCIEGTFFGKDEADAAARALKELTHRINLRTGVYYRAMFGNKVEQNCIDE
jgi:hypothetical protein